MWRFLLNENIRHLRELLSEARSDEERQTYRRLVNEALDELRTLEKLSTSESSRRDPALKIFAERSILNAMKLNGAQFGILQVYDSDQEALTVFAQRNLRAAFLADLPLLRLGAAAPSARSFAANGPVTIEDTEQDASFAPSRPATREAGIRAMVYVPVRRTDGEPLGVLSTHYSEPHQFSQEDVERLERYARSIGPILEIHLRRADHSAA